MIKLSHIVKTYDSPAGPVHALKDISLTVARGEIFGIIGLSGAGKSTLLRLMNGLIFPEVGRYLFEGTEITARRMREHRYAKWFHQRVGYVWQNPAVQLFSASEIGRAHV